MTHRHGWLIATLAALALAACGGSDSNDLGTSAPYGAPSTKGSFSAVVAFGDSLSDVGTYAPATSLSGDGAAPYFGGKFTTNGTGATLWVENLATTLGLAITPNQVGFGTLTVDCPAQAAGAAAAATCTGHAQGGARVTDPNGIGKGSGALTVPVKTQIANHHARFGDFKASDLVLVYAGNNDVFVQFDAYAVAAGQAQAQAVGGAIPADEARRLQGEALTAAQTAVKQAAQELAAYVRDDILAKGGKYVAVMNLPDSSATPAFQLNPAVTAEARTALSGLVDNFNQALRDGLANQPVLWVDARDMVAQLLASPATHGLSNTTTPACDATKIAGVTSGQITDGSSLFCNGTPNAPYNGLTDGADVSTWLFADGVHPTTGGHKAFGNLVTEALKAGGWL